MKKIISIVITSVLLFNLSTISKVYAQNEKCNLDYKWMFSVNGYSLYNDRINFINSDENYSYLYELKSNNKSINIFIIDLKRDSSTTVEILLPKQYYESEIIGVNVVTNNVIIFSSFFNQKDNKTYYFRESFSLETKLSLEDLKMIFEIPLLKKDVTTRFIKSKNKQYFAYVVYNYHNYKELGSYIYVFDNNFNIYYSCNDLFDQTFGFNIIDDFFITDVGSFHSILRTFKDIDEANKIETVKFDYDFNNTFKVGVILQNYLYHIISLDKNNSKPTITGIDAPEKSFVKFITFENIDSDCFITGTISEKGNLNDGGLFSYKFETLNTYPDSIQLAEIRWFDSDFKKEYLSEPDKELYYNVTKENGKGLWDYYYFTNRGICKYKDGYICFLQKTQNISFSRIANDTYPSILYGNIYASYIDKKGNIIKTFKIPMHQVEMFLELTTYKELRSSINVIDDKLYVLYNVINPKDKRDMRYKKLELLEFDENFKIKTCNIDIDDNIKFGIYTFNEWVSDKKVLGFGYMNKPSFFIFDFSKIKN